jgi:hypothetical protein
MGSPLHVILRAPPASEGDEHTFGSVRRSVRAAPRAPGQYTPIADRRPLVGEADSGHEHPMAASSSSCDVSSSGLGGLERLSPQPSEGRVEAGRIIDALFPAEHLSYFAIAEILALTQHLRGLTREHDRCEPWRQRRMGSGAAGAAVIPGRATPRRLPPSPNETDQWPRGRWYDCDHLRHQPDRSVGGQVWFHERGQLYTADGERGNADQCRSAARACGKRRRHSHDTDRHERDLDE